MDDRAIAESLALVEQLKRMRIATVNGDFPLVWTKHARDCYLDLRALSGTGVPVASQALPVGTAGEVLVSDSTEAAGVRWVDLGTDLTNWVEGVQAAGGTFGTYSIARAARLLVQLQAASYYSKVKYLLPFLGADLAAARMPLIDSLAAGIAGTNGFVEADFTEATGLQGNGTSKILSPGLKPSELGTGNNGGLGWWECNFTAGGTASGVIAMAHNPGGGTRAYDVYLAATSYGFEWGLGSTGASVAAVPTNAHYYGQRSSATSRAIYKNGTSMATEATNDPSVSADFADMLLMGEETTNVVAGPRYYKGRAGCAYMTDGSLTAGEITAFHTLLQDYLITPTGR